MIILDGWGIGAIPEVDAIRKADTPFYDSLLTNYPSAELVTYGSEVGLPEGQMGNSEVGHLNIGAGRIVYQELARINKAIREDTLATMQILMKAIIHAKETGCKLHLMGLVSDGGVHSHISHLKALCDIMEEAGLSRVFIHAFLDGRDTAPTSGKGFVSELLEHTHSMKCELASLCGRYFAMDRDLRWERVQKAYDLLIHGKGIVTTDPLEAIQKAYDDGTTDEFMEPHLIHQSGNIEEGDVVLFFNFRTDRPRQLVRALTQENFPDFGMSKMPLHFVTMVSYDAAFQGIGVIYEKENLSETLGEVLAANQKTQLRIAETEKYPHVTFFFNGGREEPYVGEHRIVIPSPKVATYDLAPEMSAFQVTDAVCNHIEKHTPDFICLNYANADMVGHTGDFEAAQKACEAVDQCLNRLVDTAIDADYELIIIADHGNSDFMINEDGSPHTAHTTNPVPVIFVSQRASQFNLSNGKLADVAPTILTLMDVNKSSLMTGESLLTFK